MGSKGEFVTYFLNIHEIKKGFEYKIRLKRVT